MGEASNNSTRHEYYLDMAEQSALRSTCLRRNFGAVIVKHDQIIATGYGGAPRKTPNCCDIKFCYRGIIGARKGEHYEYCRAVHAEQNALIQASRLDMRGATLYLVGLDNETKEPLKETEPCRICKRLIANAGIRKVIARQGEGLIKEFLVKNWISTYFSELKEEAGHFVPVKPPRTLSDPVDEERSKRLISRFSLADALVIQISSYDQAKDAVGRIASRYFIDKVTTESSVALSCGDTIFCMLEHLHFQSDLELSINQLSIEGDATMIHQAPATLVGLLRAKCSPKSNVLGIQLPPLNLSPSSLSLRKELMTSHFLNELKRKSCCSDFTFVGVGSAGPDSASFWAMAQSATDNKFPEFVAKLGIIGEMNNQVFDQDGKDCTHLIPGFGDHVINIVTLEDLRQMARNTTKQKVVMVATGPTKTQAMRIALETGLANVLITGRDDADQLLSD